MTTASDDMVSANLKLYVLDGGTIEILDWSNYRPSAASGTRMTLANPVYLIVHDEGTLIWDAGLGDGLTGRSDPLRFSDHAVFTVTESIAQQLERIGHSPSTVTYLGLSHAHRDHIGNADLFARATLLIQGDEYDSVLDTVPGRDEDRSIFTSLAEMQVRRLDGDHDVFGDGLVVIKRLAGHTVGHQSLLVRLEDTGPVLLSGDLAHTWENWEQRVVPTSLNFDPEESARSLDRAEEILTEAGASLWVQHDLRQYRELRRAPEFYR